MKTAARSGESRLFFSDKTIFAFPIASMIVAKLLVVSKGTAKALMASSSEQFICKTPFLRRFYESRPEKGYVTHRK
ncbi:hypothetical protein [Sporosarcina limicola]|uniref:Uncharacterized protein n=1 Tax=Sporosarcina limicola TaxID=34101 RepID=A0A927MKB3_9BACL|nr:hypothetical protein [Sporosarcina limicola]MBE1554722.1 hypothetical protein [Sporosarcina limicola]